MRRLVVVGHGLAGLTAARAARDQDAALAGAMLIGKPEPAPAAARAVQAGAEIPRAAAVAEAQRFDFVVSQLKG